MAGGLYQRLKTWGLLEIVQNTDLNKEFDNIKNNFMPQQIASYSQNVSQSNTQIAPGPTGSEVLQPSLAGDISNMKYQLAQIIGDSSGLWRASPGQSLNSLSSLLGSLPNNRIISGRTISGSVQPMFIVPNGTTNGVTIKGASTNLSLQIAGSSYILNSDLAQSGFTTAPSSNNTAALQVANIGTDNAYYTKNWGDYWPGFDNSTFSDFIPAIVAGAFQNQSFNPFAEFPIQVLTMGSAISNLTGSYQAFKYQHGGGTIEYFIGFVSSSTVINKCYRGFFFDKNDAAITAQPMFNADTISLMQLTWLYLSNTGTLTPSYTNPRYSPVAPGTPSIGDYWFDNVNNLWKSWNGSVWITTNSTLIGMCVQDGTNTVCARSFDTYRSYSDLGQIAVENYSTTEFRSKSISNRVNVYGNGFSFGNDFLRWTTSNMDSGVTLAANTAFFLYLSETATPIVSDRAPHRRWDIGGFYHPSKPWRCFGMIYGAGASTFDQNRFAPLSQLNGEFLNDGSISNSKRKSMSYAQGYLAVAGIDGILETQIALSFSTSSGTPVSVTDGANPLSGSLYCTGRPTFVGFHGLIAGSLTNSGFGTIAISTAATYKIYFLRDGVIINSDGLVVVAAGALTLPTSAFWMWDFPTPGLHAYTVKVQTSAGTLTLTNLTLNAFQL